MADPLDTITDPDAIGELGDACGWRDHADPSLPPFAAGAVGFVTDELSRGWLGLDGPDERPAPAPALPPLWFGRYAGALCVAPDGRTAWAVGPEPVRRRWGTVVAEAAEIRARSVDDDTTSPAAAEHAAPNAAALPRFSLDAAAHADAVARAQAWIAAGDLYQLNLTLHVDARWTRGGVALARALWAASPGAAHAAYLDAPGAEVVSVSPETFLRSDGHRATTRPIKGTRPRGATPAADAAAASALRASAKDAAEHVMIVDLERNDLGRVSVPGSVRVEAFAALEAHPTVWHLASTVSGDLRADVGLDGLLGATFPCGSVTGAPKRMAVARTALLEPWRRGVYCGAIGIVTRGLIDLSVAIRTAVVSDGRARYGTGGGIVADSDPAAEFSEAMDKAAAFFTATGTPRPDR